MKKKFCFNRDWKFSGLIKLLKVMKLTVFILLVSVAGVLANKSYSQSKMINLNMRDATVKEVIKSIEEQSEFYFLYSENLINVERKVNVTIKNKKIEQVLNLIFEGTDVDYSIRDRFIVLTTPEVRMGKLEVLQQQKTVSGKVTDSSGSPLPGVTVVVKNTTQGTITNAEGDYSLDNVPGDATLVFSFVGMRIQEIPVAGKTSINVLMAEKTISIEEVVAIGYGTQTKSEVASAISSVRSENFIKMPTTDAAQLIRGQVAGLSIIKADANPVTNSQISLRGVSTLVSSTTPLILIDGIPGSLNTVSPDDIEQIDVLKDGSAAAIYGTRGTNGVILITTKNAKGEMPTEVDVNAYVATQQIIKRPEVFSADEYRELVAEGKSGAQDDGASVNWLDEVMQTPMTKISNISLRGGSKNTNYIASFEYRGIDGLMKRSNNKMIYPRIEVNHRMFNDKLKLTASLSGYKQEHFSGSDDDIGYDDEVYRNAITYNPTTPIKDDDGNWSETPSKTDYRNPIALIKEVEGKTQATDLRMYASVVYSPFEGVNIKYLASSDIYNMVRGYFETSNHINSTKYSRTGYACRRTTRNVDDLSELTISWNKTLMKYHTFNLLGGYSWMRTNYQYFGMSNYDFSSDDYTYNNMGNGSALADGLAGESSSQEENKLIGYFGRFNYSYKNKYMLAASVRYEGSSKFGTNHKWGTFPAVSAAWSLKKEDFLENVAFLSQLKLRAGYGETGTEPSSRYMSLSTLSFSTYAYYNGEWIKTIRPAENANPDLKWERKQETNIGIDFGFLNDRLTGTIDYYRRMTKDLIWDYSVPSPPFLYSDMTSNGGSIRNRGIEISLAATPVQKSILQWHTSMNFSTNKSELISLSSDQYVSGDYSNTGSLTEPLQTTSHRIQVGEPIGNFYGFKSIDIDDDGYWIIEGADGEPKSAADEVADDKQVIGNGVPKYYLNWNNTILFKNFDLNLAMRGAFCYDILNSMKLQFGVPVMLTRGNLLKCAYDKIYGKVPLADDQSIQYVSYYLENGSYWKIDNVTLGYTFKLTGIKKVRIYGSVSNLATITGYSGLDPEVAVTGLAPGVDDKNRYPSSRTYTLGVSVKF